MVESNRSLRPFSLHTFSRLIFFSQASFRSDAFSTTSGVLSNTEAPVISFTNTSACWATPLVSRNLREISTILYPRQYMTRRGSSVTSATMVASRFSSSANFANFSQSSFRITTAMRSWDSEIASSVPSRPAYFLVTLSRLIFSPSASSPMATETPPAPKSLQRFISTVTSGFRNRRWIFRSVGGFPFCTSAPQVDRESTVCSLEEPVAPPMPSRPVRPPSRTMISPAAGRSRITALLGAAPMTAPISIRFATTRS